MVLLLKNSDIESLLSMKDAITVVEDAYRETALKAAGNFPRYHMSFPRPSGKGVYVFKSMCGGVAPTGYFAIRLNSDVRNFKPNEGIPKDLPWYDPIQRGGTRNWGVLLLYSLESGDLLSVMDEHFVSKTRVGATTAVGAKHMATEGPGVMAMLGSGEQATTQFTGISEVRKLEEVRVYSPNPANRKRFAELMEKKTGVRVKDVASGKEAVEGSNIVICATNNHNSTPVIDGDWVGRGAFVATNIGNISIGNWADHFDVERIEKDRYVLSQRFIPMGRGDRELDEKTVVKSDVIVATSKREVLLDQQADLMDPVRKGLLDWGKVHELGDVLTGKAKGRENDSQVTLFHNTAGMGIQFASTCGLIYQHAISKGVGKELPDDWFSEDRMKWLNPDAVP